MSKRQNRHLQAYCDLVINPRLQQHPSLGQLQALRWYMLQAVVQMVRRMTPEERVAFYRRIEGISAMAPRYAPCSIDARDAFRLALDLGAAK